MLTTCRKSPAWPICTAPPCVGPRSNNSTVGVGEKSVTKGQDGTGRGPPNRSQVRQVPFRPGHCRTCVSTCFFSCGAKHVWTQKPGRTGRTGPWRKVMSSLGRGQLEATARSNSSRAIPMPALPAFGRPSMRAKRGHFLSWQLMVFACHGHGGIVSGPRALVLRHNCACTR